LNDSKADPLKQALKSHQGSVNYLAFSPDGQILASGSNDNTVRLYHLAMNTSHTLNGHIGQVQFVVFSPDGQILASGSDDATVQLWNTAIGALQQTLKGHSGSIICLAFSLDGQLLASSSSDQTIRLWDTSIGAVLRSFRLGGIASSLQFSADGRYLSTNLGSIALPPESNDHASNKIWENVETIALGGQWVLHQGERVLRLPPEHRFNLFAFSRSTIALGDSSGRVLFITFSFD
jgi:WD40 repeat protein